MSSGEDDLLALVSPAGVHLIPPIAHSDKCGRVWLHSFDFSCEGCHYEYHLSCVQEMARYGLTPETLKAEAKKRGKK